MFHEYSNLLVLAPHADDEVIGALGTLCAFRGAITIAFLTDGAPPARWRPPGLDRTRYRRTRREEAGRVWQALRPQARLHFAPFPDQQLAFCLDAAATWLAPIVAAAGPDGMLTPAFEGGHPDHDATNLLASVMRARAQLAVWEYALYTARAGVIRRQEFPGEPQWTKRLHAGAAACKRVAFALYRSQASTLADFSCGQEALRPLPRHDYSRPPISEPVVYELWGWPWKARDIARQFSDFLARRTATCAS